MRRINLFFLLLVGITFLASQSALATTLEVGKCIKGLPQFSTIQAAVNAAPALSTVRVCAGTYPEQVVISTPLNLVGIASGTDGRVIVAFPAGGLAMTVTSVTTGATVAPQVLVTTGPVNITNITVDGTGNNISSPEHLAGIMYESGASGTVNGVLARLQNACGGCGIGIWAENGSGPSESVTIENSQIHSVDTGMFIASSVSPPTLTATVKGNQTLDTANYGMQFGFLAGTVSGNAVINHNTFGISLNGTTALVISNTVAAVTTTSNTTGIQVNGNGIVKSNVVMNDNGPTTGASIDLSGASGATVEANRVTDTNIGIEFACKTGNTVSGNTVNGAAIGLDKVPTGLSVPGTVQNVDTLRTGGC